MAFIVSVLGSLLGVIFDFLTKYLAKRFVFSVGLTILIVGLIIATFSAINGFLSVISYAAPSELANALAWFLPSNTADCIATLTSVRVILWVYSWKQYFIQQYAGAGYGNLGGTGSVGGYGGLGR